MEGALDWGAPQLFASLSLSHHHWSQNLLLLPGSGSWEHPIKTQRPSVTHLLGLRVHLESVLYFVFYPILSINIKFNWIHKPFMNSRRSIWKRPRETVSVILLWEHYKFYHLSCVLFNKFHEEFAKYREIAKYCFVLPLVLKALCKFHLGVSFWENFLGRNYSSGDPRDKFKRSESVSYLHYWVVT